MPLYVVSRNTYTAGGYEAVLVEYLERCAETHRRWLLISIGVQFFIP
jgi:hypothetical protein